MKRILIALFALLLFAGCAQGDTEDVNVEEQTQELLSVSYVPVENPQGVYINRHSDQEVFLKSGVDAVIEFYNNADEARRLVIFNSEVDVVLAPNERMEIKIKSPPQTIEYVFGNDYKQIIVY